MEWMRQFWGLWLWLLLLQACAVTGEAAAQDGGGATTNSALLAGKRFRPGKLRTPPPSPKPPATDPAAMRTREPAHTGDSPRPAAAPVRSAKPSYKLGESDGGPGRWEAAPTRPKGAGYQQKVTGAPEGVEYAVPAPTKSGKVLFDGYKGGKLQDAKDWTQWPPEKEGFWQRGVLEEARKQLAAAQGTPIEWHLPSKNKADAVRALFKENGIKGIAVELTPKE